MQAIALNSKLTRLFSYSFKNIWFMSAHKGTTTNEEKVVLIDALNF